MKTFSELLTEDKGGKNLHLEHIEDEIPIMVLMVVDPNQLYTITERYVIW